MVLIVLENGQLQFRVVSVYCSSRSDGAVGVLLLTSGGDGLIK